MKTFILDNGGYNLKIGLITDDDPILIPNSVVKAKQEKKRVFVAQEQDECIDKFSLYYVRPIEKGYIVNWDIQQQIWEKAFNRFDDGSSSRIVLTDNNYLMPALQDSSSEILFEYFDFESIFKGSASSFIANHSSQNKKELCVLVIDSGFSFTTVAPFYKGSLIQNGLIRIDIGGKALTNKLKDWISYRQLNVTEETHIMNECKEDLCFVSQDFSSSLEDLKAKYQGSFHKRYVMPDFHASFRGVVQDLTTNHDSSIPSITLGIERFSVPEILFRPSDIDVDQMGLAEAVVASIMKSPIGLRASLSENIVIVGGSSKFPGFRQRLHAEIRSMMPTEFIINISEQVQNPETHAWTMARDYVVENDDDMNWIGRSEWEERGDSLEYSNFFKTVASSYDMPENHELDKH